MKINRKLSSKIIKNSGSFSDDFYKRFPLKKYTVRLNKSIQKTYSFPTFYGDVELSIMIFLCSYKKALKLMPDSKMKPVKMTRGKSLIVFSCYQYKTVNQMICYNEVGISVPVLYDPALNIPLLPMMFGKFYKNNGYHVISMPVTSLESKIRGDEIWGLPKTVQEIDFTNEGNCKVCSIKNKSGNIYLQLKTPIIGKHVNLDESTFLYTKKDGRILKSQTWFKGNFCFNKFNLLLFKPIKNKIDYIKIGDFTEGKILKDLEIEENPFQTRFSSYVTSAFDLPLKKINTDKFIL